MKSKYLIVDDEPLARKLIHSHTAKIEGLELAGECANAIEASNFLRAHTVDLIFLDIQMPEINGLQFIETLKKTPSIIFTTAFRDFAPEAFNYDAIDYLLKPISFERLLKAVNKFYDRKSMTEPSVLATINESSFIYIKSDRKIHKIACDEIVFIESLDEYVKIYLPGKVLVSRENISTLENKLPQQQFIRIHRSFIVSIMCEINFCRRNRYCWQDSSIWSHLQTTRDVGARSECEMKELNFLLLLFVDSNFKRRWRS